MPELGAGLESDYQDFAGCLTRPMETVKARFFKRFARHEIEREIEEELRLHLELLTQENLERHLSVEEATDAARERFGDFEQFKNQCVEISRRSNPFIRVLKSFLILVFLAGVLVRILSPELHVTHMGNILIAVAVLSRLLLYVRSLNPSKFLSLSENSSLRLNEHTRTPFRAYDQRRRTPLERVISNK
jgi:Flp pilus assembly protein TadB